MHGFEPGLFDKLFDDESQLSASSVILRRMSVDEMKAVVARDLESLLNTRICRTDSDFALYPHCSRSVLTYGLDDFAGMSLTSHDDRVFICNSLKNAIERHETRLREVDVFLVGARRASNNALCFNISALLVLPGMSEPVNFDALLQPTTLQYLVTKSRAQPAPATH